MQLQNFKRAFQLFYFLLENFIIKIKLRTKFNFKIKISSTDINFIKKYS